MTGHAQPAGAPHAHPAYVKIWGILVILLIISVLGPTVGLVWVTLITAFGVAIIKALMVAAYFMHLNIERTYIKYMLFTILALLMVLFAGIAPDVMKQAGTNWRQTVTVKLPPPVEEH